MVCVWVCVCVLSLKKGEMKIFLDKQKLRQIIASITVIQTVVQEITRMKEITIDVNTNTQEEIKSTESDKCKLFMNMPFFSSISLKEHGSIRQ